VLVRCVFDLVFVTSMDDSSTIGNISVTRLECVCIYIHMYVCMWCVLTLYRSLT